MNRAAARPLPAGLIVAWYGDDFTGSAAVMEVLTFAGLDSVLFLGIPTQAQLGRFPAARGIGIAGDARSQTPVMMESTLPPVFRALADLSAPVSHYKICSTFDSAPDMGSIGKAIDLAAPCFDGSWFPLLPAAPAIRRFQAFGNLFATVDDHAYRLDRHPTMSRHPVTPMTEADVRVHLARQTDLPIGLVDLVAMRSGRAAARLDHVRRQGARIVALDVVDDETLAAAGELIWSQGGDSCLAIGSQGVEYALTAYWQACGLLPPRRAPAKAAPVERMAVVSGSCSPVTAAQVAWAQAHGFRPIRLDATLAVDADAWSAGIERAACEGLRALSEGADPIVFTALGPDDPAIGAFRTAAALGDLDAAEANARVGAGLGRTLHRIVQATGIGRAVIAGGDTSSHATAALGIDALTALASAGPGAALFNAYSPTSSDAVLELALKGGQMGELDYFGCMKEGGRTGP